jgi:hypothetical protein
MTVILQRTGPGSGSGYEALVEQIKSYSENYGDDFVAQIPTMVRQAERRIYNEAQLPLSRKTTLTNVAIDGIVQLPVDYIEAQEVYIGDTLLLRKEPSFLVEVCGSTQGMPKYYAYEGQTQLRLAPRPFELTSCAVSYFGYPESIVTAGESWLYTNYDHLLLSACLFEAAMYMKAEPDMVAMYKAQYDAAIAPMKVLTRGDRFRSA